MLIKHNQKNLTLIIYKIDDLTKFSATNVKTIMIDLNDMQRNFLCRQISFNQTDYFSITLLQYISKMSEYYGKI